MSEKTKIALGLLFSIMMWVYHFCLISVFFIAHYKLEVPRWFVVISASLNMRIIFLILLIAITYSIWNANYSSKTTKILSRFFMVATVIVTLLVVLFVMFMHGVAKAA